MEIYTSGHYTMYIVGDIKLLHNTATCEWYKHIDYDKIGFRDNFDVWKGDSNKTENSVKICFPGYDINMEMIEIEEIITSLESTIETLEMRECILLDDMKFFITNFITAIDVNGLLYASSMRRMPANALRVEFSQYYMYIHSVGGYHAGFPYRRISQNDITKIIANCKELLEIVTPIVVL